MKTIKTIRLLPPVAVQTEQMASKALDAAEVAQRDIESLRAHTLILWIALLAVAARSFL